MTYKGIDLTPLITLAISLLSTLLGWAGLKVGRAADAAKAEKTAQAALLRIGVLATTILGRAWDTLAPQVQAAIADGKVTAEERAALERAVRSLVGQFVGEDELEQLARAIGLPLPGLIAKLASMVLDQFTKAHDPDVPTESALAFPVAAPAAGFSDAG